MPRVEVGFEDNPAALYQWGPILYVRIGFDSSYRPETPSYPNIPPVNLPALVDTGALSNCIDGSLAKRLQLPVVDRRSVTGVHGPVETDFYAAQIYIPAMNWIFPGIFAGLPLIESNQPYYALIGRAFLHHVTFTYEGKTGRVVIDSTS